MLRNESLPTNPQEEYLHYHNDGLLDIFIGMDIFTIGLGMLTDIYYVFIAILPAILIPMWRDAKKKCTAPRMKYIHSMKQKIIVTTLLVALLLSSCSSLPQAPAPKNAALEPTVSIEPTAIEQPLTEEPAVATSAPPSEAQIAYQPRFEGASCPFELPAGQVEGQTVECGYLIVPENRTDPETKYIRLSVAIFRHPDGATHTDPILYLEGGPGGSPLEMIRFSFDKIYPPLFATGRDIIIFDQRGVGNSEPALDCPEVVAQSYELLDFAIDGQQLSKEEIYALNLESTLACGERLHQEADLTAYNTVANAADVNDLRLALGYDQVNLWSISYGTRLALGVMRDYPEGIRSVVLDSVYPPDADLYLETPANMDRAFNVLFDRCAADETCNQAYPGLRQIFFETAEKFNANPISQEITNPLTGESYTALLDGDTFMLLIFRLLYDTSTIPLLPKIIYDTSQGDLAMIAQIRGLLLMNLEAVSRGMYYTVLCHEENPFSTLEAHQSVLEGYPELAGVFVNGGTGKLGYQICEGWEAGQAATLENQPVSSSIPALVMTGEFDPIAPPDWSKHAVETLEKAYYFKYPTVGHGASVVAGCPQEMMVAFLNDPSRAPADSCLTDMSIEFTVPTDLSEVNLTPLTLDVYGIRALAPQGWYQPKPEYHISPDTKVELVVVEVLDEDHEAFLTKWGASEPFLEIESNDLNWSLREVVLPDQNIAGYLATAPSKAGFHMVLIISSPDKQEDLYENIFLPIVEAYTIDESLIPAKDTGDATSQEVSNDANITLEPYTSEELGLSGVTPEGWAIVASGMYARGDSASDQTVLIQKSYPGMTLDQINSALLPQLGVGELPASLGQYENEDFTWDLYKVKVEAPNIGTFIVDIAQFEDSGTAYMVLLQTLAEDYQSLHEFIFMPAVEALKNLE
jgi:pimeloyl-ACP methyl ester carboxylesterase